MKYTNAKGEWVEIVGAHDMPMSALHDIYAALDTSAPIINRVLKAHNLVDWDGAPVDLTRTVADALGNQRPYANVSVDQLAFIRQSILKAISDEELDPEA